jgi:uncharacterized membrane protein
MKNRTFIIIMFCITLVCSYLFGGQLAGMSFTQSAILTVAVGIVGPIIGLLERAWRKKKNKAMS